MSEARKHLPDVVESVRRDGEAVVLTRYGEAVATIVPKLPADGVAKSYPLRGEPVRVASDFDRPMPGLWQVLAAAEGAAEYGGADRKRRKQRGRGP